MQTTIGSRLKHAWNAFFNKDPTAYTKSLGSSYSIPPDRPRLTRGNERTIVNSIYNRIALDVASVDILHVRLDDNKRFLGEINDGLNSCFTLEANIDQSAHAFKHDIALSLLDEGCVAVVPVDTDIDPLKTASFDILTMRTGKVLEWFPRHVRVRLYNDNKGIHEDILLPKDKVALIQNPFYAVMNEPNSTLQRLVRKLNLLDFVDEQNSSGKLDLIIQLPYTVKSETRKQQAELRRNDIAQQLTGSKYGIAYTDSTERITQLNRPIENNLMSQIEYLTNLLFSQLGITQNVLDGTADEKTMLNYYTRIVDVIAYVIADEFKRKFLTKTARTQGHSIECFREPFKLAPVSQIAEIADKFTRNEIMSKNEIRQIIGMKPSNDPKADELRNSNISRADDAGSSQSMTEEEYNKSVSALDDLDSQLDDLEASLNESA